MKKKKKKKRNINLVFHAFQLSVSGQKLSYLILSYTNQTICIKASATRIKDLRYTWKYFPISSDQALFQAPYPNLYRNST